MTYKTIRPIMFLCFIMAVLTGPAAAHDTDSPHTHDPASKAVSAFSDVQLPQVSGAHTYPANGAPMAFLVIPIGGESFPFHWLWHTMRGERINDRIHLVHEVMGWYNIPHFHQPSTLKDEADLSTSLPQIE